MDRGLVSTSCPWPARLAAAVVAAAMMVGIEPASAQTFGSFEWDDATGASDPDKPLTVYFRAPSIVTADTPVWFVMHGSSRNADDYRDYLGTAPGAADALVLAPEFDSDAWPGSRSYNLGNVALTESNPIPRNREEWSFSKIEPLFDHVRSELAPQLTAESYSMYGHSAGAQFIHRYLMWEPNARLKVAVAANAGWYTLPTRPSSGDDYPHPWPYSLADAPDYDTTTPEVDGVPAANVENVFRQRLVVMLGEDDVLRTSSVRQTEEADDQGLNRFERGQFYFAAAEAEAERLGLPFNWGLQFVPDVGHSGQQMAVPAAEVLRLADASTGDYNADGVVDANDYEAWAAAFGDDVVPGLGPDGSGDGVVDAADYALWRDALLSTAAATPEPTALVVALIAAALWVVRRPTLALSLIGVIGVTPAGAAVTLLLGGDTSHGENYQERYAAAGKENVLQTRGYDACLDGVRPLADGADLVVLNLETPLTLRPESPLRGKDYCHWSHPVKALASLRGLGVGAVCLANNHALDFGPGGLTDTLEALSNTGIRGFGAGVNAEQAGAPLVLDLQDGDGTVRVALVGAFERRRAYEAYGFYADEVTPGVNPLDVGVVADQIAAVRRDTPGAFVIVTPHWGRNYVWRSSHQRELAEAIIEAGADMVVGHGAHRLQEIERIDGRWVFYSIGNFVFNSGGRFRKLDSPPYSLPLRVRLVRVGDRREARVHGFPIVSDNRVTDYRPRMVTAEEMAEVQRLLLARDEGGLLAANAEWSRNKIGHYVSVTQSSLREEER